MKLIFSHRRSKANVVTCCLGDRINSNPCCAMATVSCTRTILKNMMNSSFSSNQPGAIHTILHIVQNSQRGKELNKFCPPNSSDDLGPFFCICPSSMILVKQLHFTIGQGRLRNKFVYCYSNLTKYNNSQKIQIVPNLMAVRNAGQYFKKITTWCLLYLSES